jgi:hypothetical protein
MTDTSKFERLVEALDLSALPLAEQDELLLDLNSIIFKGSLVRMIENMDEATREEFAALMENEVDEEELEKFLSTKVPGAEAAVQEAVEALADDILAVSETD